MMDVLIKNGPFAGEDNLYDHLGGFSSIGNPPVDPIVGETVGDYFTFSGSMLIDSVPVTSDSPWEPEWSISISELYCESVNFQVLQALEILIITLSNSLTVSGLSLLSEAQAVYFSSPTFTTIPTVPPIAGYLEVNISENLNTLILNTLPICNSFSLAIGSVNISGLSEISVDVTSLFLVSCGLTTGDYTHLIALLDSRVEFLNINISGEGNETVTLLQEIILNTWITERGWNVTANWN